MTMRCEDAQELITGLVDNELTAAERTAVESHLADCPDCRGQFGRESALKKDLRRASAAVIAPAALRAKIRSLGDAPATDPLATERSKGGGWFAWAHPRPVWAFAVVVLVVASWVYQLRPQEDIGAIALATHERVVGGREVYARNNNPAELRKELALAVGNRFAPVPLDFSMAKLYPVAGFVKKIGGRDVLVTIYEGAGPTITCYTFLGNESDAPKDAELFRDEEMRVNFFTFSKGDVSAVLHAEGEVICLLIAKRAPAELLDLLRGKAHHA